MDTYIPGILLPQAQGQVHERQPEKRRGGGRLLGGIEGIPTSMESIKRYKKAACPTPKAKRMCTANAGFNF
jgi:hypothetical protein